MKNFLVASCKTETGKINFNTMLFDSIDTKSSTTPVFLEELAKLLIGKKSTHCEVAIY